MIERQKGPPESEVPASATETGHPHASEDDPNTTADRVKSGASLRLVKCARPTVSLDCGCRGSGVRRCSQPPLSEQWVTAGRDAALHILGRGYIPLLDLEVLRALWRRGGRDRRLAQRLHQMTGGRIA